MTAVTHAAGLRVAPTCRAWVCRAPTPGTTTARCRDRDRRRRVRCRLRAAGGVGSAAHALRRPGAGPGPRAAARRGPYLCSPRTMYRVLGGRRGPGAARPLRPPLRRARAAGDAAERALELGHHQAARAGKWTYYYLYVMLDVFSRYVVGWMVAQRESAALAEQLIAETCAKQGIARASSRSTPIAARRCREARGLAARGSRRHQDPLAAARLERQPVLGSPVQDAQVPPRVPGPLRLDRARPGFSQDFFPWYNIEHHHSGLGLLTPADVHHGLPPRCARAAACSQPPTPRIPSASSAACHTRRSADRRLDQPAGETTDRSGCSRTDDRHLGRPSGRPDSRRDDRPRRYSNYFPLGVSMSLTASGRRLADSR